MSLIDDIKRDREAGTPGPWTWDKPYDGYYECLHLGKWLGGIEPAVCDFGNDTQYYPSEGVPPSPSDARRIARVPDMESALIAAEEHLVATLEAIERGEGRTDGLEVDMASAALTAYRKTMGGK